MANPRDVCTIAAAGDAILTRRITPYLDTDEQFAELRSVIDDADVAVANLEVIIPERDAAATPLPSVPSQYQYLSPLAGVLMRAEPFVLNELNALGFDIFATASNHSFDYGRDGMTSTMAELRKREIPFAGMGGTLADARRPGYVESAGGRVGLVAANASIAPGSEAGPTSPAHSGRAGINPLHLHWVYGATADQLDRLRNLSQELGIEELKGTWLVREDPDWKERSYFQFMHMSFEEVTSVDDVGVRFEPLANDVHAYLSSVSAASARSNYTIASLHAHQASGGVRNTSETPDFLREFARRCIDTGADMFVGTGPHVLRGMEIYEGSPVFYSLGNFAYETETIEQLPAESFDYYNVDNTASSAELFQSRYFDKDGNPTGSLARDEYWETVVPICRFKGDTLVSVQLYPCSLGQGRDLPQRGTPTLATGDNAEAILARFAALSKPFGVEISVTGGIGTVVR